MLFLPAIPSPFCHGVSAPDPELPRFPHVTGPLFPYLALLLGILLLSANYNRLLSRLMRRRALRKAG
jgi:hypothetical protein